VTGNVALDYAIPVGSYLLDPRVTFSYTGQQWETIFQGNDYTLLSARHL